jgi:hypothetical protein
LHIESQNNISLGLVKINNRRRSSSYPILFAFLQSDICMYLPLQDNLTTASISNPMVSPWTRAGIWAMRSVTIPPAMHKARTSLRAIEQIDPDYIVPIHTEARYWFAKSFENVVLVEESKKYDF